MSEAHDTSTPNAARSIQSLDRGLAILELLSHNGGMTASAIGRELGLHQSSASRLLGSLMKAGFVYKPAFHLFALDYGVLLFAGKTLNKFPLVKKATAACNRILLEHGYSATTAVLHDAHLIYLATCARGKNSGNSLRLISDSSFPLHLSSLGRVLACEAGREAALEVLHRSIAATGGSESAAELYDDTMASLRQHGFLFKQNMGHNRFNAARTFLFQGRRAALAVYSETEDADAAQAGRMLQFGINLITGKD